MKLPYSSFGRTLFFLIFLGAGFVIAISDDTRVLFVSDKESGQSQFDLYTIKSDGTDLTRLTTTANSEWAPALAPDGQQIAYVDPDAATGNIFITDLDGAEPAKVNVSNKALCVQWQDEDTLFYLRDVDMGKFTKQFEIWKVNTNGTDQTRVYSQTFEVWLTGTDSFQLHRPSNRLYFSAFEGQPATPRSGKADEAAPDTLYTRCDDDDFPPEGPQLVDHYDVVVSPDAKKLVYVADYGEGSHRLYVRDTGNACATQVRLSDVFCGDPDWAPDGSWIAFTRASESTFGIDPYIGDLVRINPDGAEEANLTENLATISGRCAHATIYSSATTGCDPVTIVNPTFDPDTGFSMTWASVSGVVYQVEYSDDLKIWKQDLPDSSLTGEGGGKPLSLVDPQKDHPHRYYRIQAHCP